MFYWMINIWSYAGLLFKAFCIDFKFAKCLIHQKFNAKINITLLLVAFHFQFGFCRSKSGFYCWQTILSRCWRCDLCDLSLLFSLNILFKIATYLLIICFHRPIFLDFNQSFAEIQRQIVFVFIQFYKDN